MKVKIDYKLKPGPFLITCRIISTLLCVVLVALLVIGIIYNGEDGYDYSDDSSNEKRPIQSAKDKFLATDNAKYAQKALRYLKNNIVNSEEEVEITGISGFLGYEDYIFVFVYYNTENTEDNSFVYDANSGRIPPENIVAIAQKEHMEYLLASNNPYYSGDLEEKFTDFSLTEKEIKYVVSEVFE